MPHHRKSTYPHFGDLMSFRFFRTIRLGLFCFLSFFFAARNLIAQAPTGGLSGVVTDPSGGVVAKASVRLTNASGASLDATTNREGYYEFKDSRRALTR